MPFAIKEVFVSVVRWDESGGYKVIQGTREIENI